MIRKAFSIYDEKGKIYNTPFYFPHRGEAIRFFEDLTNDKKSTVNKHPEDYTLYQVGDYDDITGRHTNLSVPEFLMKAQDAIDFGDSTHGEAY